MAGSYPDVPSRRMAYDADGSVCVWARPWNSTTLEWTAGNRAELNDEDNVNSGMNGKSGSTNGWGTRWAIIFPELRELDGNFLRSSQTPYTNKVEWSGDTTNGTDGSWTSIYATYSMESIDVYPNDYRDYIKTLAISNARGYRWHEQSDQSQFRAAHLYGEIAPGQTPDRLLFIDELTGLEFTAPIDWSDIPRGSSEDREFRFKNNSATQTATTIQYTAESLYLSSASWYVYTLPGGSTFSSVQQITSLAAATTTAVIKIRRIVSAAETLGLHAARVYANVASWS